MAKDLSSGTRHKTPFGGKNLDDPGGDRDGEFVEIPVITQGMIADYLTLEAAHRSFEDLKRRLKQALEAGVAVEPGPCGLELQVREQQALTAAHLIASLGLSDEQVAELKATAPTRQLRYLVVWQEGEPKPGGEPRRPRAPSPPRDMQL
jgi:hypothetical protein